MSWVTVRSTLGSLFMSGVLIAAAVTSTVRAADSPAHGVHNVVLVHGAWADGSSWSKIIPLLEAKGLHVIAVQNPLSSVPDDVAAATRAIAQMDGPVLLVGHSYGGAIISEAGNDPKVVGLVYVAAFAPSDGEAVGEMGKEFPAPAGGAEIRPDGSGYLWLTPKGVAEDFAQNLPAAEKKLLTATQSPTAAAAFEFKIQRAAWQSKPSWYIVSQNDRMIAPQFEQAMANKIHAKTIMLPSSHVAMLSHPAEVAAFIEQAARDVPTQ